MSAYRPKRRGPRSQAGAVLFLWILVAATAAGQTPEDSQHTLGHPGYLVISGAATADSASGFHWQTGPGPDELSLVWDEGMLTIPGDLQPESFGPDDLAVPCGPELAGAGNAGRLVFRPGRYPVTEPVLLTDGTVTLYVAGGELEIVGQRVRYRPTGKKMEDIRASYILLAGLVLLTVVLLRRARRGLSGERDR